MHDPSRVSMPPIFDVVAGIEGALDLSPKRGHRAHTFMEAGVLLGGLPDSDLAVLMAGEDLFSGDDDGLNQTGVGFEPREFLLILPHPNAFAFGAGVEKISGGG